MIMKRDPNILIRFLLESWSEIVLLNAYPTNKQIRDLLDSVSGYPPLMQYYKSLSEHGKVFWLDLKEFLEALSAAIASKNHHELFQSILYHLGLAFKSKEEGVDQETGKHVAWILFLLCTSSRLKALLREGSDLLTRIFPSPSEQVNTGRNLPRSLPRPISAPARHPGPDPMHDPKTTVNALEDLLEHRPELKVGGSPSPVEKVNPPPSPEAKSPDSAPDDTAKPPSPSPQIPDSAPDDTNAPNVPEAAPSPPSPPIPVSSPPRKHDSARSDSSFTNQTVDYNIPFDPSYYYQNSFPRLLGKEAKEEKTLSADLICWIDELLKDPQLCEYPLKVIKRSHELLRLIRSTSAPLTRPYFSEAMSELKMLLESLAPFFLFQVLDSCVEFFTLQLQYDLDLHEIALMTLEFLEKVVVDQKYRESDQAVYRGSTLIQQWRSFEDGKYSKQFLSLVEQVSSFVSCLLDDHEVKNLQTLVDTLLKDVATESLQGFDTSLLQDAILVVLPMLALELHTITIPLYSTIYNHWNIIIQPFSLPTISIVPQEVTVSTNHIFKVGLEHVQSETWKTLTLNLKGISPSLLNVPYVVCSLKGIKVRDQGIVDVQFPEGIDIALTFNIDEADSCPFEMIDCRVLVPRVKITFQQTRFPIMSHIVKRKVQRKVRLALEMHLTEFLLTSCLTLRKLISWIRVKLLCWKSTVTSDQEMNERIARELTDFLAALGLKKEEVEAGGKQQLSEEPDTSASARTSKSEEEDLQFLPWASRRFSVQ